jgi:putative transcriptional regulator
VPIVVRLDVVMARRKIRGQDLAERIGLTQANVSKLKTGNVKAIRFSTLAALCHALKCQPGDLLEYEASEGDTEDTDDVDET